MPTEGETEAVGGSQSLSPWVICVPGYEGPGAGWGDQGLGVQMVGQGGSQAARGGPARNNNVAGQEVLTGQKELRQGPGGGEKPTLAAS